MQCHAMQCNALHCNAMQCNAMQRNAMQCHAMQCTAMHCYAMQSNAMQCKTMQYNIMQCNTLQCSAMQCNTAKFSPRNRLGCLLLSSWLDSHAGAIVICVHAYTIEWIACLRANEATSVAWPTGLCRATFFHLSLAWGAAWIAGDAQPVKRRCMRSKQNLQCLWCRHAQAPSTLPLKRSVRLELFIFNVKLIYCELIIQCQFYIFVILGLCLVCISVCVHLFWTPPVWSFRVTSK